jgi:LmbE family N-acetylglucosaminyl deacetylase
MQNVLVISPHPDDEAIGCGGTICRHIADGDQVEVIFLTSGEKGGHGRSEEDTIAIREKESYDAAAILQLSRIEFWKEPDGKMLITPQNVARMLEKIVSAKISVIYVTHEKEDHPDHRAAALIVTTAIDQLPASIPKPLVWMYEVWTPIQSIDHIVDISPYVESKRKAIRAYKSQCEVLAFDEAILGLNRYRGEMHSWPGGDHAEIFKKPGR